jgi:flagellar basal-body rod protein FlgC
MTTHGPFSSIDVANSGLGYNKYWLDTIAHNIANVNTETAVGQEPFRARMVVAVPLPTDTSGGGGDPDNPGSNADGYVQGPVVDLAGQLGDLILASRTYQANMTVFKESRDALQVSTTLGRG